jgi:tRNA threonylcarbamoyladenosine biosynthesis protein TsaE
MDSALSFSTSSPEETMRLGERVGALLRPGDVVLLEGDLGSGKTVFVRGACRALGCEKEVRSPSFVLVREYGGSLHVFHIDLYRLTGLRDWPNLGVEDRIGEGVALVEWGEALEPLFGATALVVTLAAGEGPSDRLIRLRWNDPRLLRMGPAE